MPDPEPITPSSYLTQSLSEGLSLFIVDYAALGGRDFIGNPKQPALFVCELVDGKYVKTLFRDNNRVVPPTFSNWKLTAQQILGESGTGSNQISPPI